MTKPFIIKRAENDQFLLHIIKDDLLTAWSGETYTTRKGVKHAAYVVLNSKNKDWEIVESEDGKWFFRLKIDGNEEKIVRSKLFQHYAPASATLRNLLLHLKSIYNPDTDIFTFLIDDQSYKRKPKAQ